MTDQTTKKPGKAERTEVPLPPRRSLRNVDNDRRRWVIGLAVAALVVTIGLLAALLPSGGEPSSTAPPPTTDAPSTTEAPTTTEAQPTTSAPTTVVTTVTPTTDSPLIDPIAAEALVAKFYTDINSGDLAAATAVFTDDATFGFSFMGDGENAYTRDEQLDILEWNVGQGSQFAVPECRIESTATPLVLICETAISDAPAQVADLGGVPIDARFTIGESGVEDYLETYTGQDFNRARARFDAWMSEMHPGVLDEIDFFGWADRAEARTDGEELAAYAMLWQAFLDENGCEDPRLLCP